MDRQPLISIITVTYNAALALPPTMRSVREQSFNDFEHIIIDGASADDTLSVARELASPSLRILSERDRGIYDGMNKGLRMARGQYILFLNAGDSFASPLSLAQYAESILKSDGNADIIYSDTVIVDDNRNVLRPRHLSAPASLTRESFSHGMLICHQAFMVRREIAPEYDLQYRFSADYDWTIRCIDKSKPEARIRIPSVEIHYLDDGATEHNKLKSLRERYEIMSRHYGLMTALRRHASFIPRALKRRLQ